jgi:hypothetical protein
VGQSSVVIKAVSGRIWVADSGGRGGTLRPGRYLKLPAQPMTYLLLGMLDGTGERNVMIVQGVERIGNSTGRLDLI